MKTSLTRIGVALSLISTLFITGCGKDDSPATVNPTARFAYTSVRNFPVSVTFTNTSSDVDTPGYSYSWDFGDGTQSSALNPVHVYTTAGTYSIGLNEISPGGSGSVFDVLDLSASTTSGVSGRPSSTNFNYTVTEEFTVTFTDQSQNATNKTWTFGDGTTANNPGTSFTHVFSGSGPFVVQLSASSGGASAISSATLNF